MPTARHSTRFKNNKYWDRVGLKEKLVGAHTHFALCRCGMRPREPRHQHLRDQFDANLADGQERNANLADSQEFVRSETRLQEHKRQHVHAQA